MDKADTNCDHLILRTAQALDEDALMLLALSTIRNSLKHRIEVAIKDVIIPHAQVALESSSFPKEQQMSLIRGIIACFPNILPSFKKNLNNMAKNAGKAANEMFDDFFFDKSDLKRFLLFKDDDLFRDRLFDDDDDRFDDRDDRFDSDSEDMQSKFLFDFLIDIQMSLSSFTFLCCEAHTILLGTTTIIIMESALSLDLSSAVDTFRASSISSKLITLVDMEFNKSQFIPEHAYALILQIINGNFLEAILPH